MRGKVNCYDNAAMESFFATLIAECVFFENYKSKEEGEIIIFYYYNFHHRHSTLNYLNPSEFERRYFLEEFAHWIRASPYCWRSDFLNGVSFDGSRSINLIKGWLMQIEKEKLILILKRLKIKTWPTWKQGKPLFAQRVFSLDKGIFRSCPGRREGLSLWVPALTNQKIRISVIKNSKMVQNPMGCSFGLETSWSRRKFWPSNC